jgi:hypothetical protein
MEATLSKMIRRMAQTKGLLCRFSGRGHIVSTQQCNVWGLPIGPVVPRARTHIRYHHMRELTGNNSGRAYWGWSIVVGSLILYEVVRWTLWILSR